VTGAYALYRMTRRRAVAPEDRATFVPLPSGTSPYVITLTPGVGDELYPATAGTFERGPVRLHWTERGAGDPVVLLHDAGSSAAVWDDVLLTLADTAHRALAYDLRGHGRSTHTGPYDTDAHVDDLHALLSELRIVRCTLVGHGHGSTVAIAFAHRHPERVDGLVLVSSDLLLDTAAAASTRQVGKALEQAGRAVLPRRIAAGISASATYGRRRHPQSYNRLASDLRRADRDAITALRRSTRTLAHAGAVERLPVPYRSIRGDRLRRRDEGDIVIAHAGHFVQIDQPDELGRAIGRFMQDLPSAANHR
jgi:pimeloyl-ACP methyl ester carboxylesterase